MMLKLKSSALWQPRGIEWGGKEVQEKGTYVYTYDCFMLMYGRSQHNIVKQLPYN